MASCSALLMVDFFTNKFNKFYSLAEKQLLSLGGDDTKRLVGGGDGDEEDDYIEIVGSSHGWIALCNFHTLELFLWNPVNRRRINLPPFNNLPPLEKVEDEFCSTSITKLILSSSNPEDADSRVVVLHGAGRLAFCCPGQSGADWISIGTWWYLYADADDTVRDGHYHDMAYSSQQNRLFLIAQTPHHELERWDLEDPWSPRMDGDDSGRSEELIYQYDARSDVIYVVIAVDEVLVVLRKMYEGDTTGFIIFKVDQDQGEGANLTLHPLHSLDSGLAMFVGLNHSFALSATQFPELRPNSIYFTDCIGRNDIGIFDYQSRIFYPCYSPQEHNHASKQHRNADESDEEDNHNAEEEDEDNDGRDEEHIAEEEGEGEEDDDSEEGWFRSQPKFVWFRPSS